MELAFAKGLQADQFGVVKDQDDRPTGQFFQKAAGFITNNLRPFPLDIEPRINDLRRIQADYLKVGVTTLIGHATGLDFLVLNNMYQRDEVVVRYYTSMDMRINPDIDTYLKRVGNLVGFSLGGMVKIPGAHVTHPDVSAPFPEGMWSRTPRKVIPEIPTLRGDEQGFGENVWALTSWTGKRWEDLTLEEKMDTDYGSVLLARKYGWNIAGVHNTGSRAIELFLNLFETAEKQDTNIIPRTRPHAIDHNIIWDPQTLELATRLKDYVRFSLKYEPFLQRGVDGRPEVTYAQYGEALHNMQPVKEMLENGIKFNLEGADPWRVPPLKRIQWYVTRQDDKGRTWGFRHAITRKQALLATTRWAARYIGEENVLGSISPGMLADLTVLGGDFLKVPEEKIASLPVDMTIVAGKVSYERP
jgi:predicted amidohydrolase YtcJ